MNKSLSNCFEVTVAKEYNLVPLPPAKIIPFILPLLLYLLHENLQCKIIFT